MSAPSQHKFCRNGHLVQAVEGGYFAGNFIYECPYCKSHEFVTVLSWEDLEQNPVPYNPVKTEKYGNKNVKIYDVSNIGKFGSFKWKNEYPDIFGVHTDNDENSFGIIAFAAKGHFNKEVFADVLNKEKNIDVSDLSEIKYENGNTIVYVDEKTVYKFVSHFCKDYDFVC